jgi:hypothetical protein
VLPTGGAARGVLWVSSASILVGALPLVERGGGGGGAPAGGGAAPRGWVAQGARLLVAHPGARATVVEAAQGAAVVGLMCGPEGGYTDAEVTTLIEQGALPVTLGPHILRAETAAVAMLAALRLQAW